MQKKLILPVAVLSVAMLAACSPNGDMGRGLNNTTNGNDFNGINNDTKYNRVTYDNNQFRDPFAARNGGTVSPFNQNTTMNRVDTNQLHNFNRAGTNGFNGMNNVNGNVNNGLGLGDLRDTNPNTNLNNINNQADSIARMVNGVRGVDSAKTLVVGNTIFVGLDIDSRVSRNNISRIEQEVHRVVSTTYPGYDVRVTSDRGLFQRTGTFFNDDNNRYNNWERTAGNSGRNR